eukprot:m.19462 g.19462  ORF g.19462 m.19462 type:complete len:65 (+) comp3745_c0_seq1:3577-3771(+)
MSPPFRTPSRLLLLSLTLPTLTRGHVRWWFVGSLFLSVVFQPNLSPFFLSTFALRHLGLMALRI